MELASWIERAWGDLKADAPKLAIRNEADLKCHLFSRLLAMPEISEHDYEVHSEVCFCSTLATPEIIVDLAITEGEDVLAVFELKCDRYPVFQGDLDNLCRLLDSGVHRSNLARPLTPCSHRGLKLIAHPLLYYGNICAPDAVSANQGDMFELMRKINLDCSGINVLPAILFAKNE